MVVVVIAVVVAVLVVVVVVGGVVVVVVAVVVGGVVTVHADQSAAPGNGEDRILKQPAHFDYAPVIPNDQDQL